MPATTIAVTITGAGNSQYCYATINGTKQYSAGTHEVNAGDTITFGVFGSKNYYGSVTIDGTQVLRVITARTETYNWTVPNGILTVDIKMTFGSGYGRITVTTA